MGVSNWIRLVQPPAVCPGGSGGGEGSGGGGLGDDGGRGGGCGDGGNSGGLGGGGGGLGWPSGPPGGGGGLVSSMSYKALTAERNNPGNAWSVLRRNATIPLQRISRAVAVPSRI
jgi:hypothetical protein